MRSCRQIGPSGINSEDGGAWVCVSGRRGPRELLAAGGLFAFESMACLTLMFWVPD